MPEEQGWDRSPDPRTWACARGLDAVQEAERVGSWQVGVEHLLAAALLDPIVRRLFLQAGGDLAAVQRRVGRPVRAAPNGNVSLPDTAGMELTPAADRFLVRLLERADDDPELSRHQEWGGWGDVQTRSTLRRWLLHDLLSTDHELVDVDQPLPGLGSDAALTWLIAELHDRAPRS